VAQVISKDAVRQIIAEGNARLLVNEAERFGTALADDKLTKTQIRGVFGTVRQIQAAWDKEAGEAEARKQLRRILLLKPRLAYQARRDEKVKPLADVLVGAIVLVADGKDSAQQTERFGYFVDLFEAILAYHTAAGGK